MADREFFKINKSEVHCRLGDCKIKEICDRYFLTKEGKKHVDEILAMLSVNDLVKNHSLTLRIIYLNTNGHFETNKIKRIIYDISELLAFPERRFLCLTV